MGQTQVSTKINDKNTKSDVKIDISYRQWQMLLIIYRPWVWEIYKEVMWFDWCNFCVPLPGGGEGGGQKRPCDGKFFNIAKTSS